jgi:hypothetical protein
MSVLKVIELLASSVGKMQHKAITKLPIVEERKVGLRCAAVSDGKISDTELLSWNSSK